MSLRAEIVATAREMLRLGLVTGTSGNVSGRDGDRIAANGDAANKIGTYPLAVLASRHGIPFYVVAPSSTVDLATPTGADIPIEERDPAEVTARFAARNPAFDVTPASLVTAIVTERCVHTAPYEESLAALRAAPEEVRS